MQTPVYDAIVIGAGPAGSTTAYRLARAGCSVLLADRARFPRDKPCAGAVSLRALRLLPFSIEPVVEGAPQRFDVRLRYGRRFETRVRRPVALMTQRRRLDTFLVEQAVAAGAVFEDGARVEDVAQDATGVTVSLAGRTVRAAALVAADGANGTAARALGLSAPRSLDVAFEGNAAYADVPDPAARDRITVELGVVPGGYGWVFPKADHVNLGVVGWESEGPRLREHLRILCERHGIAFEALGGLRGHRLPLGGVTAGALARGRVLAVGDAAGLVDPFSGDGMYEAILSGSLAAPALLGLLAGRTSDLDAYTGAVRARLGRAYRYSWAAKLGLDRFPGFAYGLVRLGPGQTLIERSLRGEPVIALPLPSRGRLGAVAVPAAEQPRLGPAPG